MSRARAKETRTTSVLLLGAAAGAIAGLVMLGGLWLYVEWSIWERSR